MSNGKQITEGLIDMSESPPPISLTKAVILISSGNSIICDDCGLFKDKVNQHFGLSIKWYECTDHMRGKA
jgi:hypothetical protein